MSRKQSYNVLIDAIPPTAIVTAFILFLLAVVASLSVLFFAPPVEQYAYEKLDPETVNSEGATFAHLFKGGYNLVGDTEYKVNKSNQEVSFAILLKENGQLDGLKKQDLYLDLSVTGKHHKDDTFGEPFRMTQRHKRTLSCSRGSYFCEPIIVFRQRYIKYPYYRISLKFLNLDEIYERGFLDEVLFTRFEFTNTEYTVFETTMRTILLAVSVIVLLFYVVNVFWSQEFAFWKTEQKWILVLLVALIGFNNPFFIAEWAGESWFFPFLNIFFQTTFGAMLILFILVISHSALVLPANRGLVFYAVKFTLVGALWVLVLMIGCWERFNEFYDPSVDISEIPFFGQLRMIIAALALVIFTMITYYTIRAIGGEDLIENTINTLSENNSAQQTLEFQSKSSRFKIFFILTFLVVVIVAVDYLSFVLFDYANNAAQYLSLYPIVNYYAILLSIFFLPSDQVESGGNVLISPGTFKSNSNASTNTSSSSSRELRRFERMRQQQQRQQQQEQQTRQEQTRQQEQQTTSTQQEQEQQTRTDNTTDKTRTDILHNTTTRR